MKKTTHFPELDALRGLAVLLMVMYHLAFDLDYFWGWPVLRSLGVGGWFLARTSATLFLLVAGICFTLSWEHTSPPQRLQKIMKRFLVLALSATLVSVATWFIAPQDFVKFGILHLFALSTLLLPLFAPLKYWNTLLGLFVLLIPTVPTLPTIPTLPPTLAILLGSPSPSFSSLDYFPLIPWFGFLLLGLALGHSPYFCTTLQRSQAVRVQRDAASESAIEQASAVWRSVGHHSLAIYLLHQPILLAILSLALGKPPNT